MQQKSLDDYRKAIRRGSQSYADLRDDLRSTLHAAMVKFALKSRRWDGLENDQRINTLGMIHDSIVLLLIENPQSSILLSLHAQTHEMASLISQGDDDLADFAEDFDMWASELQEPK